MSSIRVYNTAWCLCLNWKNLRCSAYRSTCVELVEHETHCMWVLWMMKEKTVYDQNNYVHRVTLIV